MGHIWHSFSPHYYHIIGLVRESEGEYTKDDIEDLVISDEEKIG